MTTRSCRGVGVRAAKALKRLATREDLQRVQGLGVRVVLLLLQGFRV